MGFKITLTEVGVKACALKLGYLKTIQAIFKYIELIVSIVITSTVAYYINNDDRVPGDLFLLLIIVNYFICIFCLFMSEWMVWSAVESSSKSMFEIVFFVMSVMLLLASSLNLFANVIKRYETDHSIYTTYVIMAIFQLFLIGLYSTDIIFNLCLNCCQKKKEESEEDLNKIVG